MTLAEILAVAAGLGFGALIGHVRYRSPVLGGLLGMGVSMVLVFLVIQSPGLVMAVNDLDEFEERVLQSPRPVLVDFYGDFCAPCRRLAPTIEKLAKEFKGRVDVVKIDVTNAPELANEYDVRSIPNVKLFIGGVVRYQWIGNRPTSEYRTVLQAALTGG
jgi:thioredoxin